MIVRGRYSPEAESEDHTRANLSAPADRRRVGCPSRSRKATWWIFLECPFNEVKTLSVLLSYSCTIPSFPPVKNCVGFALESAIDVIPAGEAEWSEGIACLDEYVLTWIGVA